MDSTTSTVSAGRRGRPDPRDPRGARSRSRRPAVAAGVPRLGLLLGSSGLGIEFARRRPGARARASAALVLILAEGGLTTKWEHVRPSWATGCCWRPSARRSACWSWRWARTTCSTWSWELAILLAAVLTPTDAAAVFSVLRAVPLKRRVTGTLEAESGLNDAPIVVLVVAISAGEVADRRAWAFAGLIVFELVVGALVGIRDRAARRRAAAPRRPAGVGSLSARRVRVHGAGVRFGGRRSTPAASRRSTSRRWCWATPSCRTAWPRGRSSRASAGWRRSGCS